ncbi:MAG: hypothetical protein IJ428_06440 [Clostridia bacterium]|nr:hypothetical protein [Clostridia bacterium]
MKKRITSLIIATAMLGTLALTSCGDTKPAPEKSRVTNVYKSTDITLPEDYSISNMYAMGDSVLLDCTEVISQDPYEMRRFLLDLDTETGEYTEMALPEYDSQKQQIYNLCPTIDGSVIMATVHLDYEKETFYYDLQKYENGESTVLCDNLEPLFETDISSSRYATDFYIQKVVVDGDSNIYIVTDTLIGVFDSDMKKLFELSFERYIDDVGVSADGRVYVSYRDYNTFESMFKYIDVEKRALGDDVPMPDIELNNASIYIGPGYDTYYDDGSAVWGYNEGGESVKLLDWVNSDIIQSGVSSMVVLNADTFLANYYEYNDGNSIRELYLLKRISDEEVPERYIIDFAINYGNGDIKNQVVRFNRSSDTYRVRLTEYSNYNTSDNYQLAEETLLNEFTAGTAPDVVMLSEFGNRGTLLENGVFMDLYTLMDEDESFERSMFFDSVLEPMERGGELNELVTTLSLRSIAGKSANVPYEKWTVDEFLDWAESLPENKYIFDYMSQMQMLNTLFALSLDEFVDTDKGTANFDTPTFRRLLEYSKNTADFNYRQSLTGDALTDYESDRNKVYREDTVLLSEVYIYDTRELVNAMFAFGFEDTSFVGYPTENGNGAVLDPSVSFAINADSLVAEGAWEFIKSTLTYNVNRGGGHGISAIRDNFRASAEESMKMHYFYRYDGSTSGSSSDDFLTRYSESEGVYRDITEADVALMEDLINDAAPVPNYAQAVVELIMEDLTMYFAGDKTLDETVAVINSVVGLYIAENN